MATYMIFLFLNSDLKEIIIYFNSAGLLAEAMGAVQFTLNKLDYKKTQQETAHESCRFSVGVSGIVE